MVDPHLINKLYRPFKTCAPGILEHQDINRRVPEAISYAPPCNVLVCPAPDVDDF